MTSLWIWGGAACQLASAVYCAVGTFRHLRTMAKHDEERRAIMRDGLDKTLAMLTEANGIVRASSARVIEIAAEEGARIERIERVVFGPIGQDACTPRFHN